MSGLMLDPAAAAGSGLPPGGTTAQALTKVSGASGDVAWTGPYQAADGDLTALSALTGAGIVVRTAADTYALRQIAAGSARISVTNPAGTAGNITLDVAEASVDRNALGGGAMSVANGGTGSTTAAAARVALFPSLSGNGLKLVRVNSGATDFEYVATVLLPAIAGNALKHLRVNAGETDVEWASVIDIPSLSGHALQFLRANSGASALEFANAGGLQWSTKSSTFTAVAGEAYLIAATCTGNLPASPSQFDTVYFLAADAGITLTVGRNTKTIMSLSEDMTVDTPYFAFALVYHDATKGWRIFV